MKTKMKIERFLSQYVGDLGHGFFVIGLVIGSLLAIPISFGIVWLINLIPGG